jgi:hypothetical protein
VGCRNNSARLAFAWRAYIRYQARRVGGFGVISTACSWHDKVLYFHKARRALKLARESKAVARPFY